MEVWDKCLKLYLRQEEYLAFCWMIKSIDIRVDLRFGKTDTKFNLCVNKCII